MLPGQDKHKIREELRTHMFQECDEDIQELFKIHAYTLEPLLMQLIREIKALKQEVKL